MVVESVLAVASLNDLKIQLGIQFRSVKNQFKSVVKLLDFREFPPPFKPSKSFHMHATMYMIIKDDTSTF